MQFNGLDQFLAQGQALLKGGPIAICAFEDGQEAGSTLRHLHRLGFARILALVPEGLTLPGIDGAPVVTITYATAAPGAVCTAVNRVIEAAPGQWIHYCHNAEYLFYPFCESRSIGALVGFHAEERREAMLTFVVDLYPGDLAAAPSGVDLPGAHLDRTGYYARARIDPETGHPKERQLDFFGSLRWRFEEHIPPAAHRIDRVGLFRARPGLRLGEDHCLNDEEMNTYSCPWHHNLSAAVVSFRAAKALRANPGSRHAVTDFRWTGSVPFDWSSQQLMDLGLMEAGQWF